MQTSLRGIANRARKDRSYRFANLYTMLNRLNLEDSWKTMNRRSAPGVDRETVQEYERNFGSNVSDLVERLKRKAYRARLVKRVYIPKGSGKLRPLGLPATEDKLVQTAAMRILNAIYEEDFLPCSFGYRPNRGMKDSVSELTSKLHYGSFEYIVEADIKGFFDNINHDWLIRMLEHRINDRAFIGLIKKWLKAGVLDTDGKVVHPVSGTPQGGIISPILANIYLHYVLDLWFEKVVKKHCEGAAYLNRYADDFVCAFEYKEDAERFFRALGNRLAKFGLSIAPEKTRVFRFSRFWPGQERFDFLGFEFSRGLSRKKRRIIKRRTARKKFRASLRAVHLWLKENRTMRLYDIVQLLNAKLRGYYEYYGVIGNYESLMTFFYVVKRMLFKWMNRRSQRRSYNWKSFAQAMDFHPLIRPYITEKPVRQENLAFS